MDLGEAGAPEASNEQAGAPTCHGEGSKVVPLAFGMIKDAN
jgi:hypothetical protein